jgi:hypothetical protein
MGQVGRSLTAAEVALRLTIIVSGTIRGGDWL